MERMGWVEMGWEGYYRMGWDGTLLLDGQDVDTRGAHRSPCPPLEGDVLGVELGGDDGGREPPHHLLLRGLHSSQQHLLVVAGQGQRLRVDHPPVVVDLHHHGAGVCGERAVGKGTAPVCPPPCPHTPPRSPSHPVRGRRSCGCPAARSYGRSPAAWCPPAGSGRSSTPCTCRWGRSWTPAALGGDGDSPAGDGATLRPPGGLRALSGAGERTQRLRWEGGGPGQVWGGHGAGVGEDALGSPRSARAYPSW